MGNKRRATLFLAVSIMAICATTANSDQTYNSSTLPGGKAPAKSAVVGSESGHPSAKPRAYLYVSNRGDDTISAYRIDKEGLLVPVKGSPFSTGKSPAGIAVSPGGRYLYVANFADNTISGYRAHDDGSLTPTSGSPYAAGDNPNSIAISADGHFLFTANTGFQTDGDTGSMSIYQIGAGGVPTPIVIRIATGGSNPFGIAAAPNRDKIYVANSGTNNISVFEILDERRMVSVAGSPVAGGSEPGSVTVSPSGEYVYVANATGGDISGYALNATGSLVPLPHSPFDTVRTSPEDLTMGPNGKRLYTTIVGPGAVGVYSFAVAANGTLEPLKKPLTPIDGDLRGIALSPDGRHLYIANFGSMGKRDIISLELDANGDPLPATIRTFPSGQDPWAIVTVEHR